METTNADTRKGEAPEAEQCHDGIGGFRLPCLSNNGVTVGIINQYYKKNPNCYHKLFLDFDDVRDKDDKDGSYHEDKDDD
jgi:hypothetical protein